MNAEGDFPVHPGLLMGVMADNHLSGSLAIELLQPERVEDLCFLFFVGFFFCLLFLFLIHPHNTSALQKPLHFVK